MNTDEATHLVTEMIGHAIAGESDRAADLLDRIGNASTPSQMYGVCCAFAEVGKAALTKIYGHRAPDTARGDMWAMQEIAPGALDRDPPGAFAVRFMVAYANGDTDTSLALYDAALKAPGDNFAASICALLADVAGLARLALDQQRE